MMFWSDRLKLYLHNAAVSILENYELFDIYEGEQVKKGYKSVAYSLSFRAKDRTLEEADINAALKKILNGLEQLGIELRQ